MINKLIKYFFENRFITLVLFGIITLVGVYAVINTPVDALPDLSENQVVIMTEWSGQSPQNVEDQVTYPLTVGMQGLAGVRDVRAMSQLGISMVTVIFEDNTDEYFARDRVIERLSVVANQLPPDANPILGPDATGLGQIYMYTLESDEHSLTELRSIQDFTVKYILQSVKGVAEIASVGGYTKTYQVIIDPIKLNQFDLSISSVINEIKGSNNNVSGKVIKSGDREIAIQAIGFFQETEDIASLTLGEKSDGLPLSISDIAEIREAGDLRRGILANDKEEKVGGIVVMRYGENPLEVINAVKEAIEKLDTALPEGVTIEPFYDRTSLIKKAITTLKIVVSEELVITTIILGIFLYHLGSTLIAAIALVVGLLISFILMYFLGIPSNIMSLGGIAIAIGTMVDSAIVITENAYNKLAGLKNVNPVKRAQIVLNSSLEVGKPIVFAIFIIILSFVPIFTLQGMEGKLFKPLAYTNMFAMVGALIASLFLVPLLSTYFLKGNLKSNTEIPIIVWLQKHYKPILEKALAFRKATMSIVVGLILVGGMSMLSLGSEFMPPLDEGSIMYMPMTVPDVSEVRASELLLYTNEIIASFPEVEKVVGKAGRADSAMDPAPLAMLETFITLKPKSEWRKGMTKGKLIREMNKAIKIDELWNGFTQPIIGRIDMLSTGIRSQVGIKVFGDDSRKLEEIAIQIEELMNNFPGASGVAAIRTSGLQYMDIELDNNLLAKHGIQRSKALNLIAAGVGGKRAGFTIQGRERYGIDVKLKQAYRQDVDDIRSLMLVGENNAEVTLDSVANIQLINGPAVINSENGVMRSAVQMNVVGKDLVSFVEGGREYIEENLELPEGYFIEWAGQYQNQVRAKKTLTFIVPIVIALIFFFLFVTYKDIGLVSIVAISIPLSFVGGILALLLTGTNMSVAVWVGFIALFGNAVETGMVIIIYLENAFRKHFGLPLIEGEGELIRGKPKKVTKEGIHEAVLEGAMLRLRPVLMTAFTSIIGLLPMLISTGVGAEVQKPLALVVVGGLTTSVILTLIVIPVLFSYLREKKIGKVA
jgi:copper/silver efflux system protein